MRAVASRLASMASRWAAAAATPVGDSPADRLAIDSVRRSLVRLTGAPTDYNALLDDIDDSVQVVCIGEPSHGTHEAYKIRALLTQRLIVERGFSAVVLESDFPSTSHLDAYIRGHLPPHTDSTEALDTAGFDRFPQWMWRNS